MAYQIGSIRYGRAAEPSRRSASVQVGALVQHGGAAYIVDVASVTASGIVCVPCSVKPTVKGLLTYQGGMVGSGASERRNCTER